MIEGTETKDVFKPENVNVLIGCEYSQVIMQEFLALGFNAYSCDLLPCEGPYPQRHFQEDVFEVLKSRNDFNNYEILITYSLQPIQMDVYNRQIES